MLQNNPDTQPQSQPPEGEVHVVRSPGFECAYASVMGEHTPGANSDSIGVTTSDLSQQVVIADGITGNLAERKNLTGQFAAQFVSEKFPVYWRALENEQIQIGKVPSEFPRKGPAMDSIFEVLRWIGRSTGLPHGERTYYWMAHQSMRPEFKDVSDTAWLCRVASGLDRGVPKFNSRDSAEASTWLNQLGPSAVANLILKWGVADDFKVKVVSAILQTSDSLVEVAQRRFAGAEQELFVGSTLVGLLRSGDYGILVAAGDSIVCIANGSEMEVLVTEAPDDKHGSTVNTCIGCHIVKGVAKPRLILPINIEIKVLPMEQLKGRMVLVASDGIVPSKGFFSTAREASAELCNTIFHPGRTFKEIIDRAIEHAKLGDDRFYVRYTAEKPDGSKPTPDDKTLAIVRFPEMS